MAETKNYYYGLGRRKQAIATVRLYTDGKDITINDMPMHEYLNNATLESRINTVLTEAGFENKLRVSIHAKGGGKGGQADAAVLGIARALIELNADLRPTLKKAGLLTRDPREKERKKYGLKKARRAPQFSKR